MLAFAAFLLLHPTADPLPVAPLPRPAGQPLLPDDSIIPIPTGYAGRVGLSVSAEFSTATLIRFGALDIDPDGETGWEWHSFGPTGRWEDWVVKQTEDTRTRVRTRVGPGVGPREVECFERFLGTEWSVLCERYRTRWGDGERVTWQYFPLEGVCLFAGFDILALDLCLGFRWGF